MNLGETKKYIDQQLSSLGWTVQIDGSGYEKIHQHTQGNEDRVIQLYYKLVSLGSKRPKREINGEVVRAAIADLATMPANLDISPGKPSRNNYNPDQDRLTIDQLARTLEMTAAPVPVAEHKADSRNAKPKSRGNGANGSATHASARKAAGSAVLPKILIVDSSPTIRAVVTRALETDFSIIQASDGQEAWSHLLSNNDIEMVITGLTMPKLDGFALISRIRTDRGAPHLHSLSIIVVTTLNDANVRLRALSTGANDFITKFTDTVDLQTRVLTRYKLAKAQQEAEWKQIASRKSKAAASSQPADTSESMSAMNTPALPKTAAGASAQNSSSPGRHSTVSEPVFAEAPEPVYFTADKLNQNGATVSKEIDRLGSTTGITLTATLAVGLIIAGIFYFRSDTEVAYQPADVVQAGASAKTESDPPQPSASNTTPAQPPEMENASPRADVSQNVSRDVVTENGKFGPPGVKQPAKPARESSPEKTFSSRPGKTVIPSEPVRTTPKINPPSGVAPAAVPAPTDVAKAEASQAQTPPREQNPEAAAPAPVPATASTPAEEQNPVDATATPSPDPSVAQSSQQGGTVASAGALPDRMKLDEVFTSTASTASTSAPSRKISQSELATMLNRFVFVYQAGDIEQFLNLFASDVRTNAQTSRAGVREDYERLFSTTDMRQMILGKVTWEVNDNSANGWGNFEVKVRNAGQETIKAFNGSLTFHVEKINGRLQIKKLYHGQWRAGVD
jgi:CheY-like chemotaxis protein